MEKVDCVTIEGKKYILFISIYMSLGALVLLFIAIKLRVLIILVIWVIIFFSAPLFFESQFRKKFVNNASLSFTDKLLEIEIFNRYSDEIEKSDTILYSDVKQFKTVDSTKNDFSSLKIFLKNGESYSYVFTGQNTIKNDQCITDIVFKYFNKYNDLQVDKNNKIQLKPNLFATRTGKVLIFMLTVLLLFDIGYQLLYTTITIKPALILGVSLYFVILLQMRRDIQQRKLLH